MKIFLKHGPVIHLMLPMLLLISCVNDIKPDTGGNQFRELTGHIKTPGIGFQTFFRFADEDPTLQSLPFSSGSAYFRWMWLEIEPQEGNYNWALIDHHLDRARQNGQTLEFRIMLEYPAEYDIGIPDWLVEKGVSLRKAFCEDEEYYSPDLEDPVIKEHHEKLIRALGDRYDGHPDLGSVDIGSVGLWGEWHEYCQPELMPDRTERETIIDLYYESFPNTPLVALVDDKEAIAYAAAKGRSAWRGDCWGNYLPEGSGWNHHLNSYWPAHQIIPEAWKNGPVALESCYTMKSWYDEGDAIGRIMDDAIAWHASLVHNKSDYVPQKFRSDLERLVKLLGFRLVLQQLIVEEEVEPGSSLKIQMNWENKGIAPPYRDFRIALRLRDSEGKLTGISVTPESVKGKLPGPFSTEIEYPVPIELTSGEYALELALVFHAAHDRILPLAIEGRMEDGWYVVGEIQIK